MNNDDKPRPYTRDEMREMFVDSLIMSVDYWDTVDKYHDGSPFTQRERIAGAVFSALALLDGCSMGASAFMIIPMPHPDDKEYHRSGGENWWPDPAEKTADAVDLAGELHSLFCQRDKVGR